MIVAVRRDTLSLFDLFSVKKLHKSKEIYESLNINLFAAKQEVLFWRHNLSQYPDFAYAVLYPTGTEISRF